MSKTNLSNRPLSNTELSSFCGQMALILTSGISTIEGLEILSEDTRTQEEADILQAIRSDLNDSGSFAHALSNTGLFPSYLVHTVALGEETGALDEVLLSLQNYYEREAELAQSIKNAVAYPMIMIGMMIVVILVLLTQVLPIFQQVFLQLGTEMTGVSRVLMNMGNALNSYFLIFIGGCVVLMTLIFYTARHTSFLKKQGYRIIPIRRISSQISACRFAGGMALTLHSGLNPVRSLELVCGLIDDPAFEQKLEQCSRQLQEGMDFTTALHSTGLFTGLYARMVSVGAKTGTMEQVMEQIAARYQSEIDTRINNVLSVLEPTLVIVLSLIVGMILLSVMLPLLGIMAGL